jgi:polyisoprenoid-binding protein YceI
MSGEGLLSASGVVEGRFELSLASLDTGNKKRDLHLRSDDFFGVDVNPLIVFTARTASAGRRVGTVVLAGDLQVKNVSRPLVLEADVLLPSPNILVLNIETEIDRADFGITWNRLGMLKGNAQVAVLAHFVRQSGEGGS